MYLPQRCADGFMLREFYGCRKYVKGRYQTPEIICHEIRRAIFTAQAEPLNAYYWGDYKHCEFRWIGTQNCCLNQNGDSAGRCYGKTLPSLAARELRHTGLPEMIRTGMPVDPEKYLAVLHGSPRLEQLVKAKLFGLAKDCIERHYLFGEVFRKQNAGSLAKRLGTDAQAMKRLRANQGGLFWLNWLRYEKSSGKPLPDQTIAWLCQEGISSDDLKFILDRMSIQQAVNYIRRQMREMHSSSRNVLTTWKDYLSMAARLKLDTNDAIVYRARRLRRRHDELVEQLQVQELSVEAGKILERFPLLEKTLEEIRALYAYEDETFSVVVPNRIEQIIREGQVLHHCVGSSDRYWERIERRESYILFLRRTAEPEKAWYTLEVEPDGTVRQKRTVYNRQDEDIGEVTSFLQQWQKEVGKRLTAQERELAAASRSLRAGELAQLQQDGVSVRIEGQDSQLLADVLRADLMENKEEMAQAALPAAA